jgi:predicted dehydrogenase
MTIGIIGLGSIGERHARNLQQLYPKARIEILTKRASWADAARHTRLVRSEREFFSTKHDVYFITNETGKHAASTLRCIKQSPKGIFVEKPLCVTTHEAVVIKKALAKYRGVFFVAYCLQFFKPLIELKKIITRGVIGKPLMMRVLAGKDMRTWRARDYRASYSTRKNEGGVILDLIHEINYPGWLIGDTFTFKAGAYGRVALPIASEDVAVSSYRSKKGVVLSVHQDYLQRPGMRSCEVFGTKGTATWSRTLKRGSEDNAVRIETQKSSKISHVRAGGNDMYVAETKSFMKSVTSGKQYSNFEEAARDIANVEALKRHGKKI